MSLESILSFTLIVTLLVISPGPNGALILKTVPFQGKRNGFANILGFLAAFGMHGIFAIFGLSALIVSSANAFFLVKTLGAIYLAYLGAKALMDAFSRQKRTANGSQNVSASRQSLRSSFTEGFITNLLNPKVSIFYLAAFPQFVNFEAGLSTATILGGFGLVSIHAAINVIWFGGMVILVSRTTRSLSSGRLNRAIKGITGTVLIWFGYALVTAKADT